MSIRSSGWIAVALCAGLLASAAPARAEDEEALGFERTPPRLSFTDGEVSFLRPGAADWSPAQVNTALAPGDELYTAASANLELQIGARAFARAGENTQLGLTSLEPDFLQLRVTSGHLSLDLRSLKTGQTFEIDTPNAAFTVERSGYYRVAVDGDVTTFTSRRGGRAIVTPSAGESAAIGASEQVVVSGGDAAQVETYAAPELDAWDRWNYARTDDQIDAVSARYVPSGVYGADDLDHYGDWRVVPTYGAVWVPRGVAAGWAPYSTGRWTYDPYYGWTWVDDARWGWAPYHYGRWVNFTGYWGWCPGPIVTRPYYAPALVAFYGGGGFSVGVTIGTPYVGWVALGWGEPLVPWWGPARFRSHPRWAGWGGPRYVNDVAYHHRTVYNVKEINVYRNARVRDAIVAVDRDHFGRRSREGGQFTRGRPDRLSPLHGDPGVRPDRSSLVADGRSARRPPREARQRSVVATREPRVEPAPGIETRRDSRANGQQRGRADRAETVAPDSTPRARVVQPPREGGRVQTSRRPPFGRQSEGERRMPAPAPRFEPREGARQAAPPAARDAARDSVRESGRGSPRDSARTASPRTERSRAAPPERRVSRPEARSERQVSRPEAQPERAQRARPERGGSSARRQQASAPPRELPGEPANRVYRPRSERTERADRSGGQEWTQRESPSASQPQAQARTQSGGGRSRDAQPRQGGGGQRGGGERRSSRGR
ncbi:MAG TPA: DUF6600 domain-containing protein [Myxococcota bacterium]